MIAQPTPPRRPWHGSRDADRPVPRAARRAQPGSPYVRPHDLLAPGGGGGDRLVRAAHLRRKRDDQARAIMENAQQEEFKHFAMSLEWHSRHNAKWRTALQNVLFKDGDIVELGEK